MEKKKTPKLTFYNYKEPLLEVKSGYGYMGVLLATEDGSQVQCHICGGLYDTLNAHVRQAHDITVPEYKEKFGLAKTTSLVSEKRRQIMKERTLAWLRSMTDEEKQRHREISRQAFKDWQKKRKERVQPKITLETKNKRGTCPDQLLAKITEVKEKLGHVPSLAEFIDITGGQRYKHLIFTTFGSWTKALKMLKMEPRKASVPDKKTRYDDDILLEYLSIFAQENGRIPTATDSKRGLIPPYETYQRHFKTFEEARVMAGVHEILERNEVVSLTKN